MPSLVYNNFFRGLASGEFDLETGGDDIRAILCMTNTDADSLTTAATLSAFVDYDESDDGSYSRITMTGEDVQQDDPNNRAEWHADDLSFTLAGNGTRDYQGVLIYKHVDGTDANDIPLFFVEFTNQPIAKEASQIDVPWNVEGILQIDQG